MELRVLKYFLAVARTGNITAAAHSLAEKLKEKACEAGGYDNVSIILAKL